MPTDQSHSSPLEEESSDVAIIGMSGRFPGAGSIEEFWRNLRDGVESIRFFSRQELLQAGLDPSLVGHPQFVKAQPVLDQIDMFDAAFFGLSPREAEIMAPQHRLFMECAWEALENAGYVPESFDGPIGVFAGASMNTYLLNNLLGSRDFVRALGSSQFLLGIDKDYLTTGTSYKLNLKGPSVSVQTFCSTSLVAVHLACRSLLDFECDMALAGGASVKVPQESGYFFQEGGILSPDGHCRTFDASSQGTVFGSGVGLVLLKRLDDALAQGDCIRAVVKGSAINNDGALKVSFMAPAAEGQAKVVAEALAAAGVEANTIDYVEAHGTGTSIGDPIEVSALKKAFGKRSGPRGSCAIGSVKSNIGHLEPAAGVAGLIKTVLALEQRQIPPSLHFKSPNPKIDFESGPFRVNAELCPWPAQRPGREPGPRRAGVSSFGIGGTNAHVVLEEAPPSTDSGNSRPFQLLLLSARTRTALEKANANLAQVLHDRVDSDLPDIAFTLQTGRRAFNHRRMLVCRQAQDACRTLRAESSSRVRSVCQERRNPPVAFLFPGQGAQRLGMGAEIYAAEPLYRQEIDRCCDILEPQLGLDLRTLLHASGEEREKASSKLEQTALAQPALFVHEYALARLWMSWGIVPSAMIGHSLGEYVAACLSGVFSLEDALSLVAARGRLMQEQAPGEMLAVAMSEADLLPLLDDSLDLAAVNAPSRCTVSGSSQAIAALRQRLQKVGAEGRPLRTSHAFHSRSMDPALKPFEEKLASIGLHEPQIPFLSNLSGTWIQPEQARSPQYWASHLRATVRFEQGLGELLQDPNRVLLEVGPGETLRGLARRHPANGRDRTVLSSLVSGRKGQSESESILDALGQLWLCGLEVDWMGFYAREKRRRVQLPTYPFERQRFWIEPDRTERDSDQADFDLQPARQDADPVQSALSRLKSTGQAQRKTEIADWFYLPSWKRKALTASPADRPGFESWLLFLDGCGIGQDLTGKLRAKGRKVSVVRIGEGFDQVGADEYQLDPRSPEDYLRLFESLARNRFVPQSIVHLWNVTLEAVTVPRRQWADAAQDLGFYSLVHLAQAIGEQGWGDDLQLSVVVNGLQEVAGDRVPHPEKASLLGPVTLIPPEYPFITCRCIDIELPPADSPQRTRLIGQLESEVETASTDLIVAYRGSYRWIESFERHRLHQASDDQALIRNGGTYLISGGLGGLGLVLAEHLASTAQANLILLDKTRLPNPEDWDALLESSPDDDPTVERLRQLRRLEAMGAGVEIGCADVSDLDAMRQVLAQARERFGPIQGAIHAAGVQGKGMIQHKTREMAQPVLSCKVQGTLVLDELLDQDPLDFFVLFSSIISIIGEFGQVDYCGANAFLNAFAQSKAVQGDARVVAINWDGWQEAGMITKSQVPEEFQEAWDEDVQRGILLSEGMQAFRRILAAPTPQVLVATSDFLVRYEHINAYRALRALGALNEAAPQRRKHSRPSIGVEYQPPRNDIERRLAALLADLIGLDRVGRHDDFFELGGDSMLSARLIFLVREEFGINLPLSALNERPTIEGFAQLLLEKKPEEAALGSLPADGTLK